MVSGILLAGGEGRRMGAYKPLVDHGGEPLFLAPYRVLQELAGQVIIACGPVANAAKLRDHAPDAIYQTDDGDGPLAGLEAAAQVAEDEWVAVAPCDTPHLDVRIYQRLLSMSTRRDGAVATRDGEPTPLIAIYRRAALLDAARQLLDQDRLAAGGLLELLDLGEVPVGEAGRDVDTPGELEGSR